MRNENNGGQAFPRSNGNGGTFAQQGMTLRDWFAGQALAGMVANGAGNAELTAEQAYVYADEMIKKRNNV